MTATAIEATDLVKTYPGRRGATPVQAVDHLSLTVPAGGVTALLGPNGAGKSTTTKILATLAAPTSGSARVGGYDVRTQAAQVRSVIGYVSQGASADPIQTAEENLTMAARLRGLSKADARRRSTELLEKFDLADAARRPAGKLSGGMRRKLDVAVGLIHSPSVLFLDEPTTGLDPEARAAMWDEIRRLTAENLTVLLTTHYLDEADELAAHVAIVDNGRVVVTGTSDELKATLRGESITIELIEPARDRVERAAARVPELRDIVIEAHGASGQLIARTDSAARMVGAVIQALEAEGVKFGAVAVARPSLDDVYLHYAGRTFASAHTDQAAPAADTEGH